MRVAISNSRRTWGGGENWSLTAATGLAERGHEVVLVCDPASELRARAERAGGKVRVAPLRVRGTGDLLAIASGRRLFRRERIEAVVCNMEREVRMLGLAARSLGGIAFVRRRGSDYGFRNTWGNRKAFELLLDGVIVNSEATKASILRKNPWIPSSRVERIYNGIDTARFHRDDVLRDATRAKLGLAPSALAVGIVGTLLERKGHATLFEAAAKLAPRFPSLVVLVAGGEDEPREAAAIHAAAARLAPDRVRFLGHVEQPNGLYNALDVLAMPSTNEGFGYAAAEAMAAERAVVVSDASSLPEVAGERGAIAKAGDATSLAEKLAAFLGDPALRSREGSAAHERVVATFSMTRMIEHLERFLAERIREKRA